MLEDNEYILPWFSPRKRPQSICACQCAFPTHLWPFQFANTLPSAASALSTSNQHQCIQLYTSCLSLKQLDPNAYGYPSCGKGEGILQMSLRSQIQRELDTLGGPDLIG